MRLTEEDQMLLGRCGNEFTHFMETYVEHITQLWMFPQLPLERSETEKAWWAMRDRVEHDLPAVMAALSGFVPRGFTIWCGLDGRALAYCSADMRDNSGFVTEFKAHLWCINHEIIDVFVGEALDPTISVQQFT